MFILVAALTSSPLEACIVAVHNDLPNAAVACVIAKPTLVPGADPTDPSSYRTDNDLSQACADAMMAGEMAGKYGPHLPIRAREGYIRNFDNKLFICKNPVAEKPVPVLKTTNLWD